MAWTFPPLGFSVHNRVTVEPEDQSAVERLARYIMHPPISLGRISRDGAGELLEDHE